MLFYTSECEKILGYEFKDKELLRCCFTHKSYANEHKSRSYENLEYFGDAILDFIVAEYLFNNCKSSDEGDLTKMRAEIVSTVPLGEAVTELGLDKFLLVGEGERNEAVKPKSRADIFEAVLAGIYIDGGIERAKKFVFDHLLKDRQFSEGVSDDYKSMLQEYVQKRKLGSVGYVELGRSGPPHKPEFIMSVELNGEQRASAKGTSKKQAEQRAAHQLLTEMKKAQQKRN